MGHYCGFGPSVGQYGMSASASNFPQFIGTNGASKNWDYGAWHNSVYRSCQQQVYAAGISPGSSYDHVQRPYTNDFTASDGPDNSYWNIHTYLMPDHVQEPCSTDSTRSDGSDDCYWSVHTFPMFGTKPHVSQAQPSIPDGTVDNSMIVPRTTEYHEMKVHKVLNLVPEVQTVECVPPEQQSELYEKNGNNTTHETFGEHMKEEIAEYLTKSMQNEQEAQRKREEEEHVCEADTMEFDANCVLSSLKEVLYDGELSLCHFNFEQWVKQISKAEEKILLDGIADLPLLGGMNTVATEAFRSRIEQNGNPHWNSRATSLYELKFSDTSGQISQLGSKEWNIISTEEISKDIVHLTFSEKIASWSLFPFPRECTIVAKLIIQWDPWVEHHREIAWISRLHPVTIGIRLILPWDPGNYSSEIRTEWLPLQSSTTNVNLLLPWDPGEQGWVHVHNMAIILFHLASSDSYAVQRQFICQEEFNEAGTLQGNEFSLVSSPYLITVHPVLKSEPHLHLLQPDDLLVDTISLSSKAKTNLLCTPWAGKFCHAAPTIIDIWRGLEKLMCWTQYSFVLYLPTYTISLVKAVPCLLLALFCKGVQVVFIFYSSIILQVMQNTYILLLDMNAQGDLHDTDCSHLSLHEFSASIFALFKVCINIWNGADTMAKVLTVNVVDTYMRIFAPALLQVETCFLLDFSLIFDRIVHVLYIAKVEKSPTALNEQVQMGRIAKYTHWIPYSYFIGLKDFPVSINFSLRWLPAYKRAFVQWDPGIIFSVLYTVEMLTTWQDSDMTQVPDPLIMSSCMHIGAEAAVYCITTLLLLLV